jgi:hypothetical protein
MRDRTHTARNACDLLERLLDRLEVAAGKASIGVDRRQLGGVQTPGKSPTNTAAPDLPYHRPRHLNQCDLARRWRIDERTLERWRWLKRGPAYLKIGGRVAYRMEDIEVFEAAQRRGCSAKVAPTATVGR